jgi:hypothetical protein
MRAHAGNTLITFSVDVANSSFTPGTDTIEAHGTFNGWGALYLVRQGTSTAYTNSVTDTADDNGGKMEYKFVIDGGDWENPAIPCNRAVLLPTTPGASIVLPTAFFGDNGTPGPSDVTFRVDMSQQIALSNFIPGTSSVEVRANGLNLWSGGNTLTNDPTIVRTNRFGGVSSNVYVGTFTVYGSPGGADDFKFVMEPGDVWETPSPLNQNCRGNRFFADTNQTLPVFDFNDAPSTLVTFRVDMSAVVSADPNFNPASVTVNGDFINWGGIGLTNDPTALNPNIYSTSLLMYTGTSINYQFRYNEVTDGSIVYDLSNGFSGGSTNRQLLIPSMPATNLPVILFNNAIPDDYLTKPVTVTFTVDMTGAVTTDGHTFDPSVDSLYLNGAFPSWYGWYPNGSQTAVLYQMVRKNPTSIYTNTFTLPAGVLAGLQYKYGIDPYSLNFGPLDNEAPFMVNHFRVIRTTAISPYILPTDKFGSQYAEPYFSSNSPSAAQLTIGKAMAGKVLVAWLGRPHAHLMVKTNLAAGTWQELFATDGTNWITGASSTNGFVSQTNWPATNAAFFRVVKP